MRQVNWRRAAGFGAYALALLSVGAVAEVQLCGSEPCLSILTADQPERPLGPFTLEQGAFVPVDYSYSTWQLAQNYAALYYAQFRVWKRLQALVEDGVSTCPQDLDLSGLVDMGDMFAILQHWGESCPELAPEPTPDPQP